jgi:hypothetical protein
MLGGHAGVTDNTVLQYLGIVEQRTNELLQLQAFIRAKVSSQLRVFHVKVKSDHMLCVVLC